MNKRVTYFFSILTFVILNPCLSQYYLQTDSFDYLEDMSSHSYTYSGTVAAGAYYCYNDNVYNGTLRVGNGDMGSYSEITVSVTPGCDTVKLSFQMPWNGSPGPMLYADGISYGKFISNSCNWLDILLTGMSAETADGSLVIRIKDEDASFSGDSQITLLAVFCNSMVVGTERTKDDFSLLPFPNPLVTSSVFHTGNISAHCGTSSIAFYLYDSQGRLVRKYTGIKGESFVLERGNLEEGIYFYLLKSGEKELRTGKLVVGKN